jgi:hypothetical protein
MAALILPLISNKNGALYDSTVGVISRLLQSDVAKNGDPQRQLRACGQNKLHAHLFSEERVDVGFEDQWIDNSGMADRDPTLTVGRQERSEAFLSNGTFQASDGS